MSNHKIGDRVIALTNPENNKCQPRKQGEAYIVCDTMFCCKCGGQFVNIGPQINFQQLSDLITCPYCSNQQPAKGLHWTRSNLFIKPRQLEQEMQAAIEKEDYETATVLRDAQISQTQN